jgi:hypothetical protein
MGATTFREFEVLQTTELDGTMGLEHTLHCSCGVRDEVAYVTRTHTCAEQRRVRWHTRYGPRPETSDRRMKSTTSALPTPAGRPMEDNAAEAATVTRHP